MKKLLVLAAAVMLAAPAFAQVTPQTSPAPAPRTQPAAPAPQVSPAAPAQARPATPAQPAAFSRIDADSSGALSLSEIKVVDATVTQADFDRYDADHSTTISQAEFTRWQTARASQPAAQTPG
jgi:hypothetical protein